MNIFGLLSIDLAADERGWTQMKNEGPRQHPITFQHPALLALPKKERRRLLNRGLNAEMKRFGMWKWVLIVALFSPLAQVVTRGALSGLGFKGDRTVLVAAISGVATVIP